MEIEAMVKLIVDYGVSVVVIGSIILACWKGLPKLFNTVIAAYKEGNKDLCRSIDKLSNGLSKRMDKLESKVDTMDDKLGELDAKIDNISAKGE